MDKTTFFAAARSFTHANLMYREFQKNPSGLDIRDFNHFFITKEGTYWLLWYALLFNVCAFLKNQKAVPDSIQADIDAIYEPLNGLRNVAFHIPPTYFDDRYKILLNEEAFNKISNIHNELSRFFDSELAKFGRDTTLSP